MRWRPWPAPGGAATATSLSSLHLQSPASGRRAHAPAPPGQIPPATPASRDSASVTAAESRRSEEHTSELQSRQYLVCRLLLEKKKNPSHSRSPVRGGLRPSPLSTKIRGGHV